MNQAWYGPLVQLGDAGAHKGSHVQLVVFILQCHPPEKVKTLKGTEVVKSTLYVGDSSCLHVKVSLWKDNGCHELSAGDIIFLQNVKVAEFRGQTELTTAQFSKLFKLVERHDLLSCQAVESALVSCQHGPLVKEKLNLVIAWAQQTQRVLISFLNRLYNNSTFQKHTVKSDKLHDCSVNFKTCNNGATKSNSVWLTMLEGHARKCCSIAEVTSIQAPCLVEFTAKIGEMYLPCASNGPGLSSGVHDCLLFSKNLYGKGAQTILRKILCTGCETCGCPLDADHNGIYAACKCDSKSSFGVSDAERINGRSISTIFHPFYLHVWDQSGQATIHVRHPAAVLMFANIKADYVYQSLKEESSSVALQLGKQHVTTFSNQMQTVANKLCTGRLNHSLLLLFLLQSLLSSKSSEFHFKAICCHTLNREGDNLQSPLDLASFSLPITNEFRT